MTLLPQGPFLAWPPVWHMGVLVLALLLVASGIVAGLKLAAPSRDWRELSARTNAWWGMAAVFFGALWLGKLAALVLFGLLSFWALKEFVTLLHTRPADHKALFFAFLSVPGQYYWVHLGWYGMFALFIPVYMFLLLPVLLVLAEETKGFVASVSQLQWGLMAFVFGLSHLAYLLRLEPATPGAFQGGALLVFLVFLVEMSDVLQYVWGKLLGRHKILPSVSPNKTWEGFLGGVVCVSLLAVPLRFLTPFSPWEAAKVGFLVAVAGFCGGAVMSAVKRDFGVKDFGAAIPGHGGMIDRMDSLCFAAPVFFHFVRYVYG